MTRRTDLTTLRKYFSWKSVWFQTSLYQGLVIRDLVINTFLTGICRRFGIISSSFRIKSTIFNMSIIESELFCMWQEHFFEHFFITPGFDIIFRCLYSEFVDTQAAEIECIINKSQQLVVNLKYLYLNFVKYISLFSSMFFLKSSAVFYFKESFFFLKYNFLYTPFQPLINFFFLKKQFNFFYSFVDFTYLVQSIKLNLSYDKKQIKLVTTQRHFRLYNHGDYLHIASKRIFLNSLLHRGSSVSFKKAQTFNLKNKTLFLLENSFIKHQITNTITSKLHFILLIYFNIDVYRYSNIGTSSQKLLTLLYVSTVLASNIRVPNNHQSKVRCFFEKIKSNLNNFMHNLIFLY